MSANPDSPLCDTTPRRASPSQARSGLKRRKSSSTSAFDESPKIYHRRASSGSYVLPIRKAHTKHRGIYRNRVQYSKGKPTIQETAPPLLSPVKSAPRTPNLAVDGPSHESAPLGSRKTARANIDQVNSFWEVYNKAADFEDREFVKAQAVNLDTLLIFAGLFSGVNTAFILESMKTIQVDQAELGNELMRSILLTLQNSTASSPLYEEPFQAPPRAVRSTIVFFASLCCSLSAAFGAVLGKQWLNYYEREGALKPPPIRARERHKKYEARHKWRLEDVIETLPTVLQISLFLFLVALVEFLHPINKPVTSVVLGFSLVPTVLYVVTITIATLSPTSPFQTRLSIAIRVPLLWLFQKLRRLSGAAKYKLSRLVLILTDWNEMIGAIFDACRWSRCFFHARIGQLWRFVTTFQMTRLLHHIREARRYRSNLTADQLLNLRCMTFYMKRASTPKDVGAVVAAMDALDLHPDADYRHAAAASFAETVGAYILKCAADLPDYRAAWKAAGIDFHRFLKPFHLLFVRWGWFNEVYFWNFRKAVREEMWEVFSRDSQNVETASMVADILVHGQPHGEPGSEEISAENVDCILQCLNLEAEDPKDYFPYISLLTCVLHNRAQGHNSVAEFGGAASTLLSTIWIDDVPDLDFRRGFARVEVLPEYLDDTKEARRFSQYLLQWFQRQVIEQTDSTIGPHLTSEMALNSYLTAVYRLIHTNPHGQMWLMQLEKDGHLPMIRLCLQGHFPGQTPYSYNQASRANGLYCFLVFWRHESTMSTSYPPELLSPDWVELVVEFWTTPARGSVHEMEIVGTRREWAELSVSFLEEASKRNLLRVDMRSVVTWFKVALPGFMSGDEVLSLARSRVKSEREIWEQGLSKRMDALKFV